MEKTWTWSVPVTYMGGKAHDEIRQICKNAGLAGIEGISGLFDGHCEAELEAIGDDYRRAGLKIDTFHLFFADQEDISSFWETQRVAGVELQLRSMEMAARLGASKGILHPTSFPFEVALEGIDNFMRQLGKSLDVLLPAAAKLNFTIALENNLPKGGGRFGSAPEHFERFVKEFDHPNLGFCLDVGHANIAVGPAAVDEYFDVMGRRLVAFHLQDNAGDRDSHLAPGRGLCDWRKIFRRIAELKFSGTACIEAPPFARQYTPGDWEQLVKDTDAIAERALAD